MYHRTAIISDCGKYRYKLTREWSHKIPHVTFVCLNPSTADADRDDPTIKRCITYAWAWGYGGFIMVNLFALRSTYPDELYVAENPIGPENDTYIKNASGYTPTTVLAWGANHGKYLGRNKKVLSMIKNPHYLELAKNGEPKHPLYLKKNLTPIPYAN